MTQRVLARVEVVAPAAADLPEAEPLVEAARLDVAWPHLEDARRAPPVAMVREQRAEQEPADPLRLARPGSTARLVTWTSSATSHRQR